MDVVYTYKKSLSEELRYSLRSLKNLEHSNLYFAGDKPEWVKATHIKNRQNSFGYKNSGTNIDLACRDPRVSEDFILMYDDVFILKPTKLSSYHSGSLKQFIQNAYGRHKKSAINTLEVLTKLGIKNPKSYDLHVPFIINKQKKLEISRIKNELTNDPVQIRTLYGNYYQIGGRYMKDVKVYKHEKYNGRFISTTEHSFNNTGIKEIFIDKCKYEICNDR